MTETKNRRLTSWARRITDRWLDLYIERLRRDPDVSLAEFTEAEQALSAHRSKMAETYGKETISG